MSTLGGPVLEQVQHCTDLSTNSHFPASINNRLNVVMRSPTPFELSQNDCWTSRGSQLPRALSFQATMGPRTLISPGKRRRDELARRGALLAPSAIPCSLYPLISRIHCSLFSDWRRTVLSKFFDTQVPSISTEELVLPLHARCVLSRLRYNGHSLQFIYLRV